jgi:hypothetical protein
MRNLDAGEEGIADEGTRNRLGRLANSIHVRALVTANALTAIAWLAK